MERQVFIVGKQRILNQLLADLIRKRITPLCTSVDCVRPLQQAEPRATDLPLVLVDDEEHELRREIDRLRRGVDGNERFEGILALFNVSPDRDVCREVSQGAVKGVFYVEDRVENMIKGIRALLAGDLWVPHKVLVEAVTGRGRAGEREAESLTRREIEILVAVTTGATNDEIAQHMFLSSHTVKTHLHNIYKKIGVSNRLHAARWAMTHAHTFPLGRVVLEPLLSPVSA